MSFSSNLHLHTFYSDGNSSAEEYIEKAIELGFVSVGISDHSPLKINGKFETEYTMEKNNIPNYLEELKQLREKYKKDIQVYIGLEEDYMPANNRGDFDYFIGAVHNIVDPNTGITVAVDGPDGVQVGKSIGFEKLVDIYYDDYTKMTESHKPDILAHLDLVTKYNEGNIYFDTTSRWYRDKVDMVLEKIAKARSIVEINTGAVSRGYRSEFYPQSFILKRMHELGIPVTISSDCHNVSKLNYMFDSAVKSAYDAGYRKLKMLKDKEFQDVDIK